MVVAAIPMAAGTARDASVIMANQAFINSPAAKACADGIKRRKVLANIKQAEKKSGGREENEAEGERDRECLRKMRRV